jgi:hypothetical protein
MGVVQLTLRQHHGFVKRGVRPRLTGLNHLLVNLRQILDSDGDIGRRVTFIVKCALKAPSIGQLS